MEEQVLPVVVGPDGVRPSQDRHHRVVSRRVVDVLERLEQHVGPGRIHPRQRPVVDLRDDLDVRGAGAVRHRVLGDREHHAAAHVQLLRQVLVPRPRVRLPDAGDGDELALAQDTRVVDAPAVGRERVAGLAGAVHEPLRLARLPLHDEVGDVNGLEHVEAREFAAEPALDVPADHALVELAGLTRAAGEILLDLRRVDRVNQPKIVAVHRDAGLVPVGAHVRHLVLGERRARRALDHEDAARQRQRGVLVEAVAELLDERVEVALAELVDIERQLDVVPLQRALVALVDVDLDHLVHHRVDLARGEFALLRDERVVGLLDRQPVADGVLEVLRVIEAAELRKHEGVHQSHEKFHRDDVGRDEAVAVAADLGHVELP